VHFRPGLKKDGTTCGLPKRSRVIGCKGAFKRTKLITLGAKEVMVKT